jgi:hypothetical protein
VIKIVKEPDNLHIEADPYATGTKYQKKLAEMATKTEPAALAAAQKQAPPTRLVKFVAKQGDLTAVAYWGGTLEAREASGSLKFRNVLSQDITAMIWVDDMIVVGLADGRVAALLPPK